MVYPKRTMKLAFKTPSTNPIQKNPAHVLPEIQESISKDRKLPPTYTSKPIIFYTFNAVFYMLESFNCHLITHASFRLTA